MMTENLPEALVREIERNRELLKEYKSIGVAGNFGARMIDYCINNAVEALASGDVIEMVKAYESMKENE
jgi:hypothetical protein